LALECGAPNSGAFSFLVRTAKFRFLVWLSVPVVIPPDADPAGQLNCRNATTERKEFTVSDREKGTVKWFNGAKGYGFIQRTSGEDVFVHFSAIQENGYRTLNEGETVEYDLMTGPKGLQASNVVRA
jgi:CspA family cold shock protein